jgi:hypothetical protein
MPRRGMARRTRSGVCRGLPWYNGGSGGRVDGVVPRNGLRHRCGRHRGCAPPPEGEGIWRRRSRAQPPGTGQRTWARVYHEAREPGNVPAGEGAGAKPICRIQSLAPGRARYSGARRTPEPREGGRAPPPGTRPGPAPCCQQCWCAWCWWCTDLKKCLGARDRRPPRNGVVHNADWKEVL